MPESRAETKDTARSSFKAQGVRPRFQPRPFAAQAKREGHSSSEEVAQSPLDAYQESRRAVEPMPRRGPDAAGESRVGLLDRSKAGLEVPSVHSRAVHNSPFVIARRVKLKNRFGVPSTCAAATAPEATSRVLQLHKNHVELIQITHHRRVNNHLRNPWDKKACQSILASRTVAINTIVRRKELYSAFEATLRKRLNNHNAFPKAYTNQQVASALDKKRINVGTLECSISKLGVTPANCRDRSGGKCNWYEVADWF